MLPFSTGVIMEPLPVERIAAGLPACLADLRADNWLAAAQAIMTTDTCRKRPRAASAWAAAAVTVTGIAKGAGMIRPDMATMLGFVACDARVVIARGREPRWRTPPQRSFNCITVDGDTSTNDSFMLIATGRADHARDHRCDEARTIAALVDGRPAVAAELAQAIVRDGEGATKFITIRVEGGTQGEECRKVAYAIAHSPLVKTAFFASDPNLGPHPVRGRLCRHRRSRGGQGRSLSRRRAGGEERRALARTIAKPTASA